MGNEIYGAITLDFSKDCRDSNEEVATNQTAIELDEIRLAGVKLIDENGKEINLKIHNVSVSLDRFFYDDE